MKHLRRLVFKTLTSIPKVAIELVFTKDSTLNIETTVSSERPHGRDCFRFIFAPMSSWPPKPPNPWFRCGPRCGPVSGAFTIHVQVHVLLSTFSVIDLAVSTAAQTRHSKGPARAHRRWMTSKLGGRSVQAQTRGLDPPMARKPSLWPRPDAVRLVASSPRPTQFQGCAVTCAQTYDVWPVPEVIRGYLQCFKADAAADGR